MNCFEMSVHVSTLGKGSATNRTRIRLFSVMNSLVFSESWKIAKTVFTLGALKGFFSSVYPQMSCETRSLHECFLTFMATIASTFLTRMSTKMCLVSNTIREFLVALRAVYRQATFICNDCLIGSRELDNRILGINTS